MYNFRRYTERERDTWDNFIKSSKNGTFLLLRDYMEYHRDRFADHSLMVYDNKDNLIAVLPANIRAKRLDSHGGLTYGGFVTDENMKTPKMLGVFANLIEYSQKHNIDEIHYKTIPHIYHLAPAEEDLYALYLCGSNLISRNVITAIDTRLPLAFQIRRKRAARKALHEGVTAAQSAAWSEFWLILETLLKEVHEAEPVHTLDEIQYLYRLFPNNIKLYTAQQASVVVAGVVVYESERVARCQYIASSPTGRSIGALDYLIDYLVREVYVQKAYIEFGTSEAVNKPYLNTGLVDQKEGFGARAIMHDQYLISVNRVNLEALVNAMT